MIIEKEKILEAKQKLGDKQAFIIADLLNVEQFDERNLKGLCPLHSEDTPSFVWAGEKGSYNFKCFGCGRSVDIIEAYMIAKNATFAEAAQYLFEQAGMPQSFGELGVKTERNYKYPHPEQTEDMSKVYEYLSTRKISKRTADSLGLQQDDQGNIALPYYNENDVLMMVKYRPSHKVEKHSKQSKSWCQKNADTSHLLFNMNRVTPTQPLLVCEGELDCAAAIEAGYTNVVSCPFGAGNFQWIETCWDFLEQFETIIVCSDNDNPGKKMRDEVVVRLGSWRTRFIDIPQQVNGKPTKDVNEVLYWGGAEEVMNLILNAKEFPIDSVYDLSDVQPLDLSEMDGIETGFEQLDQKLIKLFYGTLTILTGINGSGKSSFISQVLCNCMDEEKSAFLYSGELPAFQTKNWLNYIRAGRQNLNEYKNQKGVPYYKVNQGAISRIDDYYRGKLFVYKDDYSHKAEDLLTSMEANARRHGCKLFVIDNLTSVSLGSGDAKWAGQEKFVKDLISFSIKFQVAVVLIVHPHKLESMRRMSKMDVQGISAIIDLAHRIISLYRVQEHDRQPSKQHPNKKILNCDVVCDVLKDRMQGYEGYSVELFYDKPSRRFFTSPKDLYHSYNWDKQDWSSWQDPIPVPQLENLPF